ncbi:MAG: hypothetical protein E7311_04125 [Clostridiales bacterium]|nr:hypothetical protein [Clostridiales bacterium]
MNIKIHYSFVLYIFILFFLGLLKYFFVFFISIVIHELMHALVGKILKLKIIHIKIDICGISIRFEKLPNNFIERIIIYIAGPLINLIIAIFTYYISRQKYMFFILSNLVLAIFNMLPIYPLDGGKILYELVYKFFYNKILIVRKIYFLLQVILLFGLAVFCINYSSIQLFFLGVYFLAFTSENKYKNMELF